MSNNQREIHYESPLAPFMEQLVKEKQATGYKYTTSSRILKKFDQFLCQANVKSGELSKNIVLEWLSQGPKKKASTYQTLVIPIRQLALLMIRFGYTAFIPPFDIVPRRTFTFSPRIFTQEEINKIIYAADHLKPSVKVPWRHLVMPELFRLLYGCGFRLSEVLNLRVQDVDLIRGVIIIRNAKFGKDRLVPPSLDMVKRLQVYEERINEEILEKCTDAAFFFPSSSRQTPWGPTSIYPIFRKLLHQCDIPHPGRGNGPRIHDLRHTFAVHRLVRWYEEDSDLNAKLPLLVAYLGHKDFTGTQKYLHLTAELFPNLAERMNKQFGGVIPHWR